MAKSRCLLCLEKLTSSTTIEITSVCQLLIKSYDSHYHDDNSNQQNIWSDIENKQDSCTLCQNCVLVTNEMEEIRQEIAKLEDRLRSKAAVIRTKLLHYSESKSSDLSNQAEFQHIFEIRESLLHLTYDAERNTCEMEEIQVKTEPEEEGDVDAPVGDKFFEESSGWSHMEETNDGKEESFFQPDEGSDESALSITPNHIEKSKCKRKRSEGNSRKLQHSGISKDKKHPKKSSKSKPTNIKRESRPRMAKTRAISKTDGIGEQFIQGKSISGQHGKAKQVVIARISHNADFESENDDLFQVGSTPIKNDDSEDEIDLQPYKCNSCSRSFKTEHLLTRHVERDHRFPCRLCESKFPTQKSRNAHLKKNHNTVYPYECSICLKKYGIKAEFRFGAHMIRHETGDKILSCSKCDKKFSLPVNMTRHLQLHQLEPNKSLSCDVCDARFSRQEGLDRHFKSHDKSVTCETCGKVCATGDVLKSHMRLHTGERPYKCDHCDETFMQAASVQAHFLRVHDGVPSHACTYCDKKFLTLSHLKSHMDRHEGKKRFTCDKCGEKFYDATALKTHRIRAHDEAKFICEECGSTFLSLPVLKVHQKTHSGVKPFKCETCGARFMLKRLLVLHTRSHTNERPYTCEHCGKRFKQTKHLSTHVNRIHTKDYVAPIKYNCPHCAKGFETNCMMQGHIRTAHTGERPFVCHLCGKGFAINTVLTLHLKGTHKLQMKGKGWNTLGRSKRDDFSRNDDSNGPNPGSSSDQPRCR